MSKEYRKLRVIALREEFVALTKSWDQALVLQQFLYWMERVHDFDEMVKELNDGRETKINAETQYGWVHKKAEDLSAELFLNYVPVKSKKNTIYQATDELVKAGYLDRRRNPHPEYKFDRTYQYKPNLKNIRAGLHAIGCELQGYSWGDFQPSYSSNGNCVDTELQSETSNSPFGNTSSSTGKAIPEITINNNNNAQEQNEKVKEKRVAKPMNPNWMPGLFLGMQEMALYNATKEQMDQCIAEFVEEQIARGVEKVIWTNWFRGWCRTWFANQKKSEKTKDDTVKAKEKTPAQELWSRVWAHCRGKISASDLHTSGFGYLKAAHLNADCLVVEVPESERNRLQVQTCQEWISDALNHIGGQINRIEFKWS